MDGLPGIALASIVLSGTARSKLTVIVLFRSQESSRASSRLSFDTSGMTREDTPVCFESTASAVRAQSDSGVARESVAQSRFGRHDGVPQAMMAVRIAGSAALEAGTPAPVFERPYYLGGSVSLGGTYDVGPDGRFLMIKPEDSPATSLVVVANFAPPASRR